MTSPEEDPYEVPPDQRSEFDGGEGSDAIDGNTGNDPPGTEIDRYRPGGDLYGSVIDEDLG
ncbi:MAG TPA: hypothetical protein VFS66_11090 [Acidimicrobiia bacterium]|nr:hypothetical protein [Acidimicrobiia bacterium]